MGTLALRRSSRKVVLQGDFTMDRQNRPSAPQQDVNISQVPMEDNKTLKDAYSTTAATILGVFQMIIGVVSSSFFVWFFPFFGPIIVPCVILAVFLISGAIGIRGAQSGNKCLVVATMVMGIVSALFALLLLLALINGIAYFSGLFSDKASGFIFLSLILALIMVIVPTISSSLTCKPLCCQKRPSQGVIQPNQAHYQPNQAYYPTNQVNQIHYQPNQINQVYNHPSQVYHQRHQHPSQ